MPQAEVNGCYTDYDRLDRRLILGEHLAGRHEACESFYRNGTICLSINRQISRTVAMRVD